MFLSYFEFVLFDDEHGSEDSSSVSINLDLSLVDISDNGILLGETVGSSHVTNLPEQLAWVVVVTNPLPVEEYLVRPRVLVLEVRLQGLHLQIEKDLVQL